MINIFMFGNDSNETFVLETRKVGTNNEARNFKELESETKSFLIASNFDLNDFMRKLKFFRKTLHLKVY